MSDINEFNEGGSHESNPLGGIPIGTNPETGQPQMVEEGETMLSVKGIDFIFSNNYKLSEQEAKDNALPVKMAGKSMSDASKVVSEMFKDRDDGVSNNTKNQFLTRLANIQESKKQLEAEKLQRTLQQNADLGYVDDMSVEGDLPQEDPNTQSQSGQFPMEQFADGGIIGGTTSGFGANGGGAGSIDYAGAAMGTIGLIDQASGNTSTNTGVSMGTGAIAGASIGTMIFPGIGTAIGAGVGAIAGAVGAGAAKKKEASASGKRAMSYNNRFRDVETFAKGGVRKQISPMTGTSAGYDNTGLTGAVAPTTLQAPTPQFSPTMWNKMQLGTEGLNVDPSNAMRYAPVLSNLNQMRRLRQPEMAPPVIDQTKAIRRPIDEASLLTGINTSASTGLNAVNQTGASTGARRNAILASNLSRNQAVGSAMIQAQDANNQMNAQADALDARTREGNINRVVQADENYARDLGAYDTTKSQMQNTFANSIGAIGLENRYANTVSKLYGYDSKGNYLGGQNSGGNPIDTKPLTDTITTYKNKNTISEADTIKANADYKVMSNYKALQNASILDQFESEQKSALALDAKRKKAVKRK